MAVGTKPGSADFGVIGKSGGSTSHSHALTNGFARLGTNAVSFLIGQPLWTATNGTNFVNSGASSATASAGVQLDGFANASPHLAPYMTLNPLIKT